MTSGMRVTGHKIISEHVVIAPKQQSSVISHFLGSNCFLTKNWLFMRMLCRNWYPEGEAEWRHEPSARLKGIASVLVAIGRRSLFVGHFYYLV